VCLTYDILQYQRTKYVVLDFLSTKQVYLISFVKNKKRNCTLGNRYIFRETFFYTAVSASYVI